MNKKVFVFFMALWFVIIIAFVFLMTNQHELTHQAIYRYFGYNSSVHLTLTGGYVQLEPNQTINETDSKTIDSLQAVNELVSYQYGILFVFVSGSFLLFIVILDSFTSQLIKALDLVQRFEEMQKAKKLAGEIRHE